VRPARQRDVRALSRSRTGVRLAAHRQGAPRRDGREQCGSRRSRPRRAAALVKLPDLTGTTVVGVIVGMANGVKVVGSSSAYHKPNGEHGTRVVYRFTGGQHADRLAAVTAAQQGDPRTSFASYTSESAALVFIIPTEGD
jgi:hypothetical protein